MTTEWAAQCIQNVTKWIELNEENREEIGTLNSVVEP